VKKNGVCRENKQLAAQCRKYQKISAAACGRLKSAKKNENEKKKAWRRR
jgi:hypothetical protein